MSATPLRGPRERNRLAGLDASAFCLGIARHPSLVTAAYRAGFNFFFISTDLHLSLYLNTILGLRELLASGEARRSDLVIAAVSYLDDPLLFDVSVRELTWLLPELGHVDVVVAGGCNGLDAYERRRGALLHLQSSGFARGVGASFHSRSAARHVLDREELDVAFVRYNPAHPGAREDLFPHVAHSRTLVYNFRSATGHPEGRWRDLELDASFWRPTYADYYRFALTEGRVDGILCAPRDEAQLSAIGPQLALGPLDEEERAYLIDLATVLSGRVPVGDIYKVGDGDA